MPIADGDGPGADCRRCSSAVLWPSATIPQGLARLLQYQPRETNEADRVQTNSFVADENSQADIRSRAGPASQPQLAAGSRTEELSAGAVGCWAGACVVHFQALDLLVQCSHPGAILADDHYVLLRHNGIVWRQS